MDLTLDARLQMVAALTPACEMAADIGADHGFLGAWLLLNGRCARVQLADISDKSLKKARRLIARLGLSGRVDFRVGDGAEALSAPPDAAIIAGMGGETIAGIVGRGRETLSGAVLVMQPNVGAELLRRRLMELGFEIFAEDLARAGGRWYLGIAARRGQRQLTQRELLIGPELLAQEHPLLPGYAAFQIRVIEKALTGARKGRDVQTEPLERALAHWKEIIS